MNQARYLGNAAYKQHKRVSPVPGLVPSDIGKKFLWVRQSGCQPVRQVICFYPIGTDAQPAVCLFVAFFFLPAARRWPASTFSAAKAGLGARPGRRPRAWRRFPETGCARTALGDQVTGTLPAMHFEGLAFLLPGCTAAQGLARLLADSRVVGVFQVNFDIRLAHGRRLSIQS